MRDESSTTRRSGMSESEYSVQNKNTIVALLLCCTGTDIQKTVVSLYSFICKLRELPYKQAIDNFECRSML